MTTEKDHMNRATNDEQLERRGRYRVSDVDRYGLTGSVLVKKVAVPVDIYDVAFAGADIASNNLDLTIDQPLTIQFVAKGMDRPAVVEAIVRWRRDWDDDGIIRYGLLFQNPSSLKRQIPTKLLGAFNRRRSFRVAPQGPPLIARITRKDDFGFSIPIISLSATGAGCLARNSSEEMVMTGDNVSVSFQLPGTQSPCVFFARVRYALKQRGGVRYGLDFDESKTKHYPRYQRRITKFVMDEQRKMLKPT